MNQEDIKLINQFINESLKNTLESKSSIRLLHDETECLYRSFKNKLNALLIEANYGSTIDYEKILCFRHFNLCYEPCNKLLNLPFNGINPEENLLGEAFCFKINNYYWIHYLVKYNLVCLTDTSFMSIHKYKLSSIIDKSNVDLTEAINEAKGILLFL